MHNNLSAVFLILMCSICPLSVMGQNGVQGEYFLLIKNDSTISINTYEDSVIVEHNTFEITEKSIFTTDKKERIAILDTVLNNVEFYDFQS